MDILTNSVPTWVYLLFLISIFIPVYLLSNLVKQAALRSQYTGEKSDTFAKIVGGFYLLYFLYTSLMSFTGIFQQNVVPPRIFLFTTIPLLIFYFFVVFRSEIYGKLLRSAALEQLIRFHIFRFIGIFFLIVYFYDALPQKFALIAGIGDIVSASLAIFAANAAEKRTKHYKKIVFVWNIIGLGDIMSVLSTAILTARIAVETGSNTLTEITYFPFCLIPAFAPATIVFLHISIFKKLQMENQGITV